MDTSSIQKHSKLVRVISCTLKLDRAQLQKITPKFKQTEYSTNSAKYQPRPIFGMDFDSTDS